MSGGGRVNAARFRRGANDGRNSWGPVSHGFRGVVQHRERCASEPLHCRLLSPWAFRASLKGVGRVVRDYCHALLGLGLLTGVRFRGGATERS